MALILLACVLGATVHHALTPNLDFFYLPWFMVAMLPFLLYLRWRQKLNCDWWDFWVYGAAVFAKQVFSKTLPTLPDTILVLMQAAILTIIAFNWEKFRRKSFPRTEN